LRGDSGSASAPRARGEDAVDRDVHALDRVGAAHRPVAAAGQVRAGRGQVGERVLQVRPPLAEERDGQVVHLRLVRRPQRLDRRGRTELGEPRQIGRVDHLQVGHVVPAAVPAVRAARGPHRVQALAHRPVAQRVEVHLEAEAVQLGDVPGQTRRVDEAEAAVAGLGTAAVQVGAEQARGEVLHHAVLHHLDRAGREALRGGGVPALDQLGHLLGTAVTVPPLRLRRPGLAARRWQCARR
jgi:hypothetical protein